MHLDYPKPWFGYYAVYTPSYSTTKDIKAKSWAQSHFTLKAELLKVWTRA